MKYQFLLETWILKPRSEKPDSWLLSKETIIDLEKVQNLALTAEPNNQQLLRNKLKIELKYEVNFRFEIQIWKPGPDLKTQNWEAEFQIYFKKSTVYLM